MSDDIVTRLRDGDPHCRDGHVYQAWANEAADEIERLRKDRDRWAKWGEHVFTCPNKSLNPCRDCVSPATADAISRVDQGGTWYGL